LLRCYVMLKTVEKIHGRRGKTFLLKLLRGSREYSVEKAVWEFDLVPFWGALYRMERVEIESLMAELTEKGWIYIEDVSTGGYTFPFVHISRQGRAELASLNETEENRLNSYLEQACFVQKSPEVSNEGILLDNILFYLVGLLELWKNHASKNMDLTDLIGQMDPEFTTAEMLNKLLYRSTPVKLQEQFREPYVVNIVCYQLSNQVRQLLSVLPEQESMVIRSRYQVKDSMYRPLIDIMKHYGLMERDVQYTVKRFLSHFANRSYIERYPFVAAIVDLLAESLGLEDSSSLSPVRDTAQVTYEMYQNGRTISEIAKERGLAVSTIYAHFARLIPKFRISLDEILPAERIANILQAADTTGGVSLRAIKEQLPSDYNYGEIRLVMELERNWKAA
jgi:uncharacterized protein YpbB